MRPRSTTRWRKPAWRRTPAVRAPARGLPPDLQLLSPSRQYTCSKCSNAEDGRCYTCAPGPGDALATMPLADLAGPLLAAPAAPPAPLELHPVNEISRMAHRGPQSEDLAEPDPVGGSVNPRATASPSPRSPWMPLDWLGRWPAAGDGPAEAEALETEGSHQRSRGGGRAHKGWRWSPMHGKQVPEQAPSPTRQPPSQ